MLKYNYFIFFLLFSYSMLNAQTSDFGIWASLGAMKDIGKWDLKLNTELRTSDNSSQIHRWDMELVVAYSIIKQVKMGLGYTFMYFNDVKYSDFQPRQRYDVFIQGKQRLGDFKFILREKIQRTIKDERDRIKEIGIYDNYKINPEWEWHNRIKIEYNIPHCRITPSLSFESFYQLNNPDGNTFSDLRYKLSFKYKLNKHHELSIYGLIDKETDEANPVKTFVGGIKYNFLL
jgi:hypothetical protein